MSNETVTLWRNRWRALIGLVLPLCVIVVFVTLLVFSLIRLSNVENNMRIGASPNMLWVVSRAQVASLRLGNTVIKRLAGEAGQDKLKLHYHLLESRLKLLKQAPQHRRMAEFGLADEFDQLTRATQPKLQVAMAHVVPGDLEAARRMHALLAPYNQLLNRAANKAMLTQWDELGEQLDASRGDLEKIVISLLGILLAGGIISIYFFLAIRDVKRRTQLLNQEKAFSHLLITSSDDSIIAVNLKWRCTIMNPAARKMFSVPASSGDMGVALKQISVFFSETRVIDTVRRAIDGVAGSLFDQPFATDGKTDTDYVDLRCFPMRNGVTVIGAILIVTDVTERRAAQRAIARHRDQLEREVRERTRELEAAFEREQVATELYRNFGTMVSHQLRTPLAVIDSSLQRLMRRRDRVTPEEIHERGATARDAIARLTQLVGSTLDAARLDAGQIKAQRQLCSLGGLAEQVVVACKPLDESRRIHIASANDAADMIHCDPAHVEHILTNLVSNAMKYSPAGTDVRVVLSANEGLAECAVGNRVDSFPPAEISSLFERYVRGVNSEGKRGLGIGLYMARGLARIQGGDVRLAVDGDGWVTFTLSLPQVQDHVNERDVEVGCM